MKTYEREISDYCSNDTAVMLNKIIINGVRSLFECDIFIQTEMQMCRRYGDLQYAT